MNTAAPQQGHHQHHPGPGHAPFPGQPPAYILPTPAGPGTSQPPDIPDTAKGSPLPHWDGVLIGTLVTAGQGIAADPQGIYVNGAFNYGDFESVDQALAAVQQLTAPADRPAAVIWRDKFGIVHAQALLSYGGGAGAPTALHLPGTPLPSADSSHPMYQEGGAKHAVFIGHPEALYVVDGDVVHATNVPAVVPVPANGATGWPSGGAS